MNFYKAIVVIVMCAASLQASAHIAWPAEWEKPAKNSALAGQGRKEPGRQPDDSTTQNRPRRTPRALTADPAVASGTLSNGINYYIVTNASQAGMAEFALVRKNGATILFEDPDLVDIDSIENFVYASRTLADRAVHIERSSITDIPRFGGKSARRFMAQNGGGVYSAALLQRRGGASSASQRQGGGMLDITDNATVYRFGSLPVSGRDAVVDSTLLMIFNIIESYQTDDLCPPDYSTSDNAIIISGDVSKDTILEKLSFFSMLIPQVDSKTERIDYQWRPRKSMVCTVEWDPSLKTALLTICYASPRTPEQLMGTSLPVVSEHMGDILSIILRNRLHLEMKRAAIPVAESGCRYSKSSERPGDERYEIYVRIAPEQAHDACRVISSILADIDSKGVLQKEYSDARKEYLSSLYIQSTAPTVSNNEYIKRCLSAFLYGNTPVTDAEKWSFLGRGDSDTTRTRLFNNFASELLDSTANLTVSLVTPAPEEETRSLAAALDAAPDSLAAALKAEADSLAAAALKADSEELKTTFLDAWRAKSAETAYTSYAVNQRDTLSLEKAEKKVKVKYTRAESITGGTLWEFSNGMKVIYKRMETGGIFYYNLLIRGGFSSMDGIDKGEGAFLSNALETYDLGGLKSYDFNNLILSNGITMSSEVTISDMSLYGTAELASLPLLMRALVTVANDRAIDNREFDLYRRGELMRLGSNGRTEERNAVIDSLFSPVYRYSSAKHASALHPDLAERAMDFFDNQFSRANDGVFVIVGDMNEDLMKKFLCRHLGSFKTKSGAAVRKKINYQPITGQTTFIEETGELGVDVAMSAPYTFTADNYMTLKVAALALQDILNKGLSGTGTTVQVYSDFLSYPQERIFVFVRASNPDVISLPLDEKQLDDSQLLFLLREILAGAKVTSDDVALYKTVAQKEIDSRQNDPWYWISMIKIRESAVKDLHTKYADKIKAVTADDVNSLISSLLSGSRVEYVTR